MDENAAVLIIMASIRSIYDSSNISWEDMVTALLASSAYAAKEAGYSADEYLDIVDTISVKSVDELDLLDNCIGSC
tara:strand:- start:462 stop:689 length:228 start_codon:yes stop_codon:yes gene_type:complete